MEIGVLVMDLTFNYDFYGNSFSFERAYLSYAMFDEEDGSKHAHRYWDALLVVQVPLGSVAKTK